jgi:hypothetical protein
LGEDHWQGERIAELINHDQSAGPDVLLILGTSLKVSGPRNLARLFARAVGANGGRVAYVNLSRPSRKDWGSLVDYWVEWECDKWVGDVTKRIPLFWPNGDGSGSRSKIVAYSEAFGYCGQDMYIKTADEKDAKDAEGEGRFELRKSHRLELRIEASTSVSQAIL